MNIKFEPKKIRVLGKAKNFRSIDNNQWHPYTYDRVNCTYRDNIDSRHECRNKASIDRKDQDAADNSSGPEPENKSSWPATWDVKQYPALSTFCSNKYTQSTIAIMASRTTTKIVPARPIHCINTYYSLICNRGRTKCTFNWDLSTHKPKSKL